MTTTVIASAPGKAFLVGEYSVLTGSPAFLVALNRRAVVTIEPSHRWCCETRLNGRPVVAAFTLDEGRVRWDPATGNRDRPRLLESVFAVLGPRLSDGEPARVTLDTSALYADGCKLGLGSSAALIVALTGALHAHGGGQAAGIALETVLDAHRRFQSGAGSGADVATAWRGGVLEYRAGPPAIVSAASLPAGVHLRWFWTGKPASTRRAVQEFSAWLRSDPMAPELVAGLRDSARLDGDDCAAFVADLRRFADRLRDLDGRASLGIFSPAHEKLATLGRDLPLVYKPCGAGGGDLGLAASTDEGALLTLVARAAAAGIVALPLAVDPAGLKVRRA